MQIFGGAYDEVTWLVVSELVLETTIQHQRNLVALMLVHGHLTTGLHIQELALCLTIECHSCLIDAAGELSPD